MRKEAQEILKKYWGHNTFRPLQEEIIKKAVAKQEVIALLPTGGGKSLCFQIPALINPGICIVISPLVALMEDQVRALKEKGIKAMALTGGIPFQELDKMLDNCIYGNYKLLYLSPERLQQEIVRERIKQMNVNLIAVDEAHCISQWGHDFRPSYLKIADLKKLQPKAGVLALTATATQRVIADIVDQLELENPTVIKKSFNRENIFYEVKKVQDKFYYLENLLKNQSDAAIVYTRSRKTTIEIATFLKAKGITASAYHGGISKEQKTNRLHAWLEDKKKVMVATNAFGMGIDKPNVRTVIHVQLPESLESYFQEAGRAGRDGSASKAIILTNPGDIVMLKNQFLETLPDLPYAKLVYKKLMAYFRIAFGEGENSTHYFNFSQFCHQYGLHSRKTYNTLQLLDRTSVLRLSAHFQKKSRIQFLTTARALNFYLENNPGLDAVVKIILRTYGGAFDDLIEINLATISSKVGVSVQETIKILEIMKTEEIVAFEHENHETSVTFLVPREDDATINPLSKYIKNQRKNKKRKIDAVLEYVENQERCKNVQLLEYFGEKNVTACGHCSVCSKTSVKLSKMHIKNIYFAIMEVLKDQPYSSRELIKKMPYSEENMLYVIKLMVEKGIVATTSTNKLKLQQ